MADNFLSNPTRSSDFTSEEMSLTPVLNTKLLSQDSVSLRESNKVVMWQKTGIFTHILTITVKIEERDDIG